MTETDVAAPGKAKPSSALGFTKIPEMSQTHAYSFLLLKGVAECVGGTAARYSQMAEFVDSRNLIVGWRGCPSSLKLS